METERNLSIATITVLHLEPLRLICRTPESFVHSEAIIDFMHLEPRQEPELKVRQDPELPPAAQGGREEGEAGQQAEQAVIHSQHQQDLGEATRT